MKKMLGDIIFQPLSELLEEVEEAQTSEGHTCDLCGIFYFSDEIEFVNYPEVFEGWACPQCKVSLEKEYVEMLDKRETDI